MIKSVNTCLTCENLVDSLKCIKHDISVEIDNVCNDHNIKESFSKMSDCLNCSNYQTEACPNSIIVSCLYIFFVIRKNISK